MLRYLKSAFWAGIRFQGIGKLPVNALVVMAFCILGFGHPAFWLIGAGLETVFLYYLSSHPRFRRVVDAQDGMPDPALPDPEAARKKVLESLPPPFRSRHDKLAGKIARTLQLSRSDPSDDLIVDQNGEILHRLETYFLKLLHARANIESTVEAKEEETLRRKISGLERELNSGAITGSLRDSQTATLEILRQRLASLSRKDETLAEIESDLTRIEAQVDMALEDASIQGKPALLSGKFDLTSHLLSDSLEIRQEGPQSET